MENPFDLDLIKIDKNLGSDNLSSFESNDKNQLIPSITKDHLTISVPELSKISSIFSQQPSTSPHKELVHEIFILKKEMIDIFEHLSQKNQLFIKKKEKVEKLETKLNKNKKKLQKIKKVAESHRNQIEIIENKLKFIPVLLTTIKNNSPSTKNPIETQKFSLPNSKLNSKTLENPEKKLISPPIISIPKKISPLNSLKKL
jgi:hypothetical protein